MPKHNSAPLTCDSKTVHNHHNYFAHPGGLYLDFFRKIGLSFGGKW
ncbi:unnamed protein product [Staurois parvus]|uniref:Uncharacterized protein n=1 Tax=Staurois parvus TaxID=386267 RepID=A0ABN9H448_9NEOB|nr:unnamed protein product [Staurois parvus]